MSGARSQFVRDWVLRTAPTTPDDVRARIGQALEVWAVLAAEGHGEDSPARPEPAAGRAGAGGWDGLPKPDARTPGAGGFHPAHQYAKQERKPPTRQELLQDEAHWREMLKRRPDDQQILKVLNGVLAQLGKPLVEESRADDGY